MVLDITKSIIFARKHGLGISIMSTGHDLQDRNAGWGPNTLLIRTTSLDPIEGADGNLWKDRYAELGAGLTFWVKPWGHSQAPKGVYLLAADDGNSWRFMSFSWTCGMDN